VTFYTGTSDQFSQYGTKVIPATMREATYVLDEILDNHSDLTVAEHTTETSGNTELVFALFTLLGLQFSPRIRDLADQRLYRLDRDASGRQVDALVSGRINTALIVDHWDDLVRVAASLKMGWAPASLLITRLQGAGRSNQLTRALQEYGRLAKTIFILRYLESEDYRRRIGRQLNKGESVHALRRFLFFAHEGQVRRRHADDQNNQAACLNLVTNAVITWNTVYMTAVIDQLRRDGQTIDDECLAHLSPALYEHINPYGHYRFELHEPELLRGLRPLRDPGAPAP
jgi:TnpA family transposase